MDCFSLKKVNVLPKMSRSDTRRLARPPGSRSLKENVQSLPKGLLSLISAALKKKQLDKEEMMLQDIQSAANQVLVWSDEKIFTVQAVVDSQNDRIYAHSARHPKAAELISVVRSQLESWALIYHTGECLYPRTDVFINLNVGTKSVSVCVSALS